MGNFQALPRPIAGFQQIGVSEIANSPIINPPNYCRMLASLIGQLVLYIAISLKTKSDVQVKLNADLEQGDA